MDSFSEAPWECHCLSARLPCSCHNYCLKEEEENITWPEATHVDLTLVFFFISKCRFVGVWYDEVDWLVSWHYCTHWNMYISPVRNQHREEWTVRLLISPLNDSIHIYVSLCVCMYVCACVNRAFLNSNQIISVKFEKYCNLYFPNIFFWSIKIHCYML